MTGERVRRAFVVYRFALAENLLLRRPSASNSHHESSVDIGVMLPFLHRRGSVLVLALTLIAGAISCTSAGFVAWQRRQAAQIGRASCRERV